MILVRSLTAILAAAVLAATLALLPGTPFAASDAVAQQECGSPAQALSQIAGSLFGRGIAPRWGPIADAAAGGAGVAVTESIGDAFNRCWEEATGESPTSVDGDPHLVTSDGLRYDFQGAGDFVLIKNPSADFEVHTRFERIVDSPASFLDGLAFRIGDHEVTFNDAPATGNRALSIVAVDGEVVEFQDGGWFQGERFLITRRDRNFFFEFDSGFAVATGRRRLTAYVPNTWTNQIAGLLGDHDGDPANDLKLRDGTVIDPADTDTLYGDFFDAWVLGADESLFTTAFDPEVQGPSVPGQVVTLADLDSDAIAAALSVCQEAGLMPGQGLEECMFDVALTGDVSWAAESTVPAPTLVSAAGVAPRITRTETIGGERIVGTIEDAGSAHEFGLPAAADGESRVLQVNAPCEDILPAAAVIIVDGRIRRQVALRCGATAELPSSAATIRIHAPSGNAPEYGFFVLGRAVTGEVDAGTLPLGEMITIEPDTADQLWRFTLGGDAAGVLFFDSIDIHLAAEMTSGCRPRWTLLDSSDEPGAGDAVCFDEPRFVVDGPSTFEIALPAGVGVTFVVGPVATSDTRTAGDDTLSTFQGEFTSIGQVDRFAIDVAAGSELLLADPSGENPCGVVWTITAGGDELFRGASCFGTNPVTIPQGGVVDVAVDAGDETGPYAIQIVRVPTPRTQEVEFGAELDASIEVPGARVQLRFEGEAGEQIILADPSAENACRIVWRVISAPDGGDSDPVFEAPSCFDTDAIELPQTGEYVVEVDGDQASVGPVAVAVWQVPEPRNEPLELGRVTDAFIDVPGARVQLSFDAEAGDELTIEDPSNTNVCRVDWRVISPAGELIFEAPSCFDPDPIPLPVSGSYVLEVDGQEATTSPTTVLASRK